MLLIISDLKIALTFQEGFLQDEGQIFCPSGELFQVFEGEDVKSAEAQEMAPDIICGEIENEFKAVVLNEGGGIGEDFDVGKGNGRGKSFGD